MPNYFIVDGHLDLAYSAIQYKRDLRLPLNDIRQADTDSKTTVCIPNLLEGGVGVVFGSLFSFPASLGRAYPTASVSYDDFLPQSEAQNQAHDLASTQLDYYHRLAEADTRVRIIKTWDDVLDIRLVHDAGNPQLGILVHMEGADPIREPSEIEMWVERGLRSIGLAWSDTRYSPGQWREAGHLPKDGYRLLERMSDHNLILDITHMSERASFDVLDSYDGPIAATHCNVRTLVPTTRQLSDDQILALAERDGIIGTVLFNKFLKPNHDKDDPKENVTVDHVIAHIDYICQLIGTADHVAIGSDFDGGFGAENIPTGIDSARDLYKISDGLREKGYSPTHIRAIMGENWLRLIKRTLTTYSN